MFSVTQGWQREGCATWQATPKTNYEHGMGCGGLLVPALRYKHSAPLSK